MNPLYFLKIIVISFLIPSGFLLGQNRMTILPLQSIGVDQTSIQTFELLLRQEIEKTSTMQIVNEKQTLEIVGEDPCKEVACAVEIGAKLNADQVVFGSLNKLGEKIIIQYTLVDVATKKELVKDNATSASVEDLDKVVKLVAMSIAKQQPIEKVNETEVSTENKSEELIEQRKSHTFVGGSIGYLFPLQGYGTEDRCFVFDFHLCFEINRVQIGGQLSIRQGVAMNISGSYLFTKTDLCPYIGGALGFHTVTREEETDKRQDGFEIVANAGIMAFRTYDFRVRLNLDYSLTFNDYDDQAITLTIGLLFPKNLFSRVRWF